VKSILKSSGEKYKKLREAGKPLYQITHTAAPTAKPAGKPASKVDITGNVASLLETVGVFDKEKHSPDDLKKVKGIGPQMEEKLNQIGIFTFAQVAKMTEREYNLLDTITGSFPGRAQRDDWAGQADRLNSNK
jgi:molybdopterin-containing oxidoreductase family membrane subunit